LNTLIYSYKHKPDIIYAHWFFPQAFTALIINKIFKIPYVFTSHAYDAEILRRLPFVGPLLARKIIQNSNSYTLDSKKAEKKLHSFLKDIDHNIKKSIVLPMPIKFRYNLPISNKISQSLNDLKNNEKILLFIGRFAEKKGVENLLEIFVNVKKVIPNLKLFIAGSGPLLKVYKQFIEVNNLDKQVYIFDYVNSNEKSKLYDRSNVSVIPSIIAKSGDEEGLPVVVIESLSRNVVTFASYQSNANEIINNGENGFLFDPLNIDKSSEELIKILDKDKSEYKELINYANKSAESFKAENSAHIFYEHLFNL
jgi:glycosyltransferase involved in cell wall biosynthesis